MTTTTNNVQSNLKSAASHVTSPFGSDAQNQLCESIFLTNEEEQAQTVTPEMLKIAANTAHEQGANLIAESVKSITPDTFSFDAERESEDCSGMEIFHYLAKTTGNVELSKNIFLKYVSTNDVPISNSEINELQETIEDVQGTLNILTAIIDESDDKDMKAKLELQKAKVEEQLKRYNNFFEKLQTSQTL